MRRHFLLDPGTVFLNHGSFGACPRPVLQAQQRWRDEMERNPVLFLGRRSAALLAEARSALADHLGARADDLVFVANATTGVNIVARSLELCAGDEVLATDHEYGACDAAWQQRCAQLGASYRRIEVPLPFEPQRFTERLLGALTPRTRLVFASHVTSTTALVFPVAELCARARALGVTTLIDGAHAPGQIDLDLEAVGADFYSGNCHKWLCAPKGTGFLHARREHHALLQAPVVSWGYVADAQGASATGGHTGFDAYTGHTLLERRLLWQGTRDISGFLAVPAAIGFQREHDWPRQRARCRSAAQALMQRVLARNGLEAIAPDAAFAQMAPIPVRRHDAEALRRRLFEHHRIEVPVTQHGGRTFVRVSVQAYNDRADLDALEAALAAEGA
ncbi:MAG: aminotransferase class V-fold PLP-dependent enzyme [Proteobacteria bacterium]|jgi:isopenicillin-N epimerase|nr:aminotransferase class V-fold PLP-dependent enzyme [Pseudomonadota bacterium]